MMLQEEHIKEYAVTSIPVVFSKEIVEQSWTITDISMKGQIIQV